METPVELEGDADLQAVVSLPMRDGNGAPAIEFHSNVLVVSLPMRDGNYVKQTGKVLCF